MHIVRCDIKRNRLNVILGGIIKLDEAEIVKQEIFEAVDKLEPGFDVLNDLSKFIHGDDSAGSILQDVTKFLSDKKAARIIRVVGQSKTGLMQFARYSQADDSIEIKYVPTMAEAESILHNSSPDKQE